MHKDAIFVRLLRLIYFVGACAILYDAEITANRNNTLHFDQTVLDPRLSRHCTSGNTRMEVDRIFACSLEIATIVLRRKIRTVQLFLFKFKSTRVRLRRNNHLYLCLKNRCQSRDNSLKFGRRSSRFRFFNT